MVTVRLVAPSGSVDVGCTIIYGTTFSDKRYSQVAQRTGEGDLRVYDTGVNVVTSDILMKNVSYTDGELLRTWIREKAIYQLNSFSVTVYNEDGSVNQEVDLGNGKGQTLYNVQLTKDTDKGFFKYNVPGLYKIKLPLTYVRS